IDTLCVFSCYGDARDLHFSLHDALPIWAMPKPNTAPPPYGNLKIGPHAPCDALGSSSSRASPARTSTFTANQVSSSAPANCVCRSEEHTSELQSRENLVCRLLLEKKQPP